MTRWLILLISCLPMLASAAEQSALGRLFLTPAERSALDIIRQNSRPPEKVVTSASIDEDEGTNTPPAPPIVTIQGYVKRSDGKGTVWVNGQPMQEKSTSSNIEVGRLQRNTNDVQIKLPSAGQTVKLKAGQSYDPVRGKIGSLRELVPVAQSDSGELPVEKKNAETEKSSKSRPTSEPSLASPVSK